MRLRLLAVSVRESIRRGWCQLRNHSFHALWVVMATVLNRFAPREMRHAAMLLGYQLALGHGREGLILGPLHEYTTGWEIGAMVRYGQPWERAAGEASLELEQALYDRGGAL